jgi:hypothetical protein
MKATRVALALAASLAAGTATAEGARGTFSVSLRVLPRVSSGMPGGARAVLVTAADPSSAVPCGAEGSSACALAVAAAARVAPPSSPVVVTVLPDGSPTAIVER